MDNRHWSVTFIGWLFIAVGIAGFVYHVAEFSSVEPIDYGLVWILVVRLLATIGGIFLLRGENWARWFVLLWMGYHVVLSAFHTVDEFVIHLVLTLGIASVLFWAEATRCFRSLRA